MTDSPLCAENLTLAYDNTTVVTDLTVAVPPARITAIIGPNGCGKSTLLRALARLLTPRAGQVVLHGRDIHTLPTREVARHLGLLPQSPDSPEGITVEDLVARGRYPHRHWLRRWTDGDDAAIEHALTVTATTDLRHRPVDELSGGQRQRVWVAMALAQDTGILLLDEPTTYLDIAYQLDVLALLGRLNSEQDRTIVVVLHDINQAARFAHHIIALREGRIACQGPPAELITPQLLADVFDVHADVFTPPGHHHPICIPLDRRERP